MKKILLALTTMFGYALVNTQTVLAQTCTTRGGSQGINTALGCIPVSDESELAQFILRWALGFAGGIALLFISYAGFMLMSSKGDPKKTQGAQEMLTASIAGIVFIVLSVFILNFIGVQILAIPGF
jgi:hypothetical protein